MEVEVPVKIHGILDFVVLESKVPLDLVDELNQEIDTLSEETDNFSDRLVGQIKNGCQLHIDKSRCETFKKLYSAAESYGILYADKFRGAEKALTSAARDNEFVQAVCYEAWSVNSFSGDYNPIHDHGCMVPAVTGLSFVLWTKIPENMRNQSAENMKSASGMLDGCINFVNGPMSQIGEHEFRPSKVLSVSPQVGKFVIFPHWLNHLVYPFSCEGERRSISGNVGLFVKDQIDSVPGVSEDEMKDLLKHQSQNT
jgi:hypothetical protein|tara:strand:- start:34 stop:798 length:765 start_codon:yes stop_codon:yes gene_type:complete